MVKRADKYPWQIGSAPPYLDPHSLVKHKIVRGYLERYVKVLMSNVLREELTLSIVDGFAGGGEYRSPDGQDAYCPGSPQIVIDTITEQEALLNVGRINPRRVNAKYYFVEKRPSNFDYLKALVSSRYGAARLERDIILCKGAFHQHLDQINGDIQSRKGGQRAIFLLDQYAYDQITAFQLGKIFSEVEGAEVILTFGVDSLISFLGDNPKSRAKMEAVGLGSHIDWVALEALRGAPNNQWRAGIQRNLAQGLVNASGATHSTIFYITPLGNTAWTYWLVHLSRSYKARDVMMELHWELANHFTHHLEPDLFHLGYRTAADGKVTGQQELELGEVTHFDSLAAVKCKSGLQEKLVPMLFDRDQPVEMRQFVDKIGSNTMATFSMIKSSLDEAIRCGDLEAKSSDGVRRHKGSSIRPTDFVGPAPQRSLIFLP
jgi:three-Cys-motif partner protein